MLNEANFLLFVLFALLLFALAWLSRRIGLAIQENVYYLTGSIDMAMVILFLVYLPGIVVHEGAHWLMAKILGLKTGSFRVWPQKRGKHIGMGSVSVASGGTLVDSLVGLAPLIVGSVLVAWIGSQVFSVQGIGDVVQPETWLSSVQNLFRMLSTKEDGFLWGYLIFAVANAMMPSSSDRQPLKSLLLYLALFGFVYLLLDQSAQLLVDLARLLTEPVQILTSALLFTLLLDVVILLFLYGTQVIILILRRPAPQ